MKGKAVLPALPWLLRMDAVQLTVHRSLGWAGGCRSHSHFFIHTKTEDKGRDNNQGKATSKAQ